MGHTSRPTRHFRPFDRYGIGDDVLPRSLPTAGVDILSPGPTSATSSVLGSQYSATSWFSGTQTKGVRRGRLAQISDRTPYSATNNGTFFGPTAGQSRKTPKLLISARRAAQPNSQRSRKIVNSRAYSISQYPTRSVLWNPGTRCRRVGHAVGCGRLEQDLTVT